jgi:hypothetical protein
MLVGPNINSTVVCDLPITRLAGSISDLLIGTPWYRQRLSCHVIKTTIDARVRLFEAVLSTSGQLAVLGHRDAVAIQAFPAERPPRSARARAPLLRVIFSKNAVAYAPFLADAHVPWFHRRHNLKECLSVGSQGRSRQLICELLQAVSHAYVRGRFNTYTG